MVLLHHNASLQHCRLPGHSPHIVNLIPPIHIFLHRLPVKKHHRDFRCHGFVNHSGCCRPVHRINAHHITSQRDKALHLVILCILAAFGILNVQCYLNPVLLFILLRTILQFTPDIIDKGVVSPIQAYPDSNRPFFFLLLGSCTACRQDCRTYPDQEPQNGLLLSFHKLPSLNRKQHLFIFHVPQVFSADTSALQISHFLRHPVFCQLHCHLYT